MEKLRRFVRNIIGYQSPVYVLGSSLLATSTLIIREGIKTTAELRKLNRITRGSERQLRLSKLNHPFTVVTGTSDIPAVINNAVREEWGVPLPPRLRPKTMIDAGAFIGDTSAYFLSRFGDLRVVALEPNERNFNLAERNLAPYGNRVRLLKSALWWKQATLRFSGEALGGSIGDSGTVISATSIQEILRTLPEGHIDILKMDIEGAEAAIFENAPEEWLPHVDHILIELHSEQIKNAVLCSLEKNGFVCSRYRSVWHGRRKT
ncbi:hypothetical protein X737_31895 [Mesorhizobium sp. L48C026A00]|nr:hypothetical protein X737_31895 [Mesorhizobium sp. L48C026A00]